MFSLSLNLRRKLRVARATSRIRRWPKTSFGSGSMQIGSSLLSTFFSKSSPRRAYMRRIASPVRSTARRKLKGLMALEPHW